jgi:hypothetical protein
MSTKKPRKSLQDTLASQFVYGSQEQSEEIAALSTVPVPVQPEPVKPSKETDLMSKLQTPAKEPTVRFTVDLSESMHRKLTMLAAKTGRKKADIVRLLLDEALGEVEE